MSTEKDDHKKQDKATAPLPPDHPLVMIRRMVEESAGRLPAPLVIIAMTALVAAVLSGALLSTLASGKKTSSGFEFLPVRVEADAASPALDEKLLRGVWVSRQGEFVSSLQLAGGKFEWMVRWGKDNNTRYYARGDYKIDHDVLVLGQRVDMGKPYDPDNPFMIYLPLSLKDINVRARLDPVAGRMAWQIPQSERKRQVPAFLRAFPADADADMIWEIPRKQNKK
jgi:hypothetical protein